MKKISEMRKETIFWTVLIAFSSIFTICYLALTGNTNQAYTDIVSECTSRFSSNKSTEIYLIYLLCFSGIVSYTIYHFISKKNIETCKYSKISQDEHVISSLTCNEYIAFLLGTIFIIFILYQGISQVAYAAILIALILYIADKNFVVLGLSAFFMGIYSYFGLYRLYVFLGGHHNTNNMTAIFLSTFAILIAIFTSDKKKTLLRLCLIENVVVPLSLLLYLSNTYKFGSDYITINVPAVIMFVILSLVASFVFSSSVSLIKKWRNIDALTDSIGIGTCIAIMAFNRFDGVGAIMPTDLHHAFENVIGYSQIFHLGSIPFKNYIPVSGMYSVVHGAIFEWFGNGTLANYYIANNMYFLFITIAIVYLLRKHLNAEYVLLISLYFYVSSYNRNCFVLPIMLLLTLPGLIKSKNLWFVALFITSLFQGLYYPLYGVATCFSFFPMLTWQLSTYVKTGDIRKDLRKINFWIGWIGCLVITVLCLPFLIGSVKHILAMSSQSIYADGISRFGQVFSDNMFSYVREKGLILSLYYILTFVFPAFVVWVAYALALRIGEVTIQCRRLIIENKIYFTTCIAVAIMLIISYSFTFVRLDIYAVYARSAYVLLAAVGMLLVFALKYILNAKLRVAVVMFATIIPSINYTVGYYPIFDTCKRKNLS